MSSTQPRAYIDGQPVPGRMVKRQAIIVCTHPRYARLPLIVLRLLEWFGVKTTIATIGFSEFFELEEPPQTGADGVIMYETTFGED